MKNIIASMFSVGLIFFVQATTAATSDASTNGQPSKKDPTKTMISLNVTLISGALRQNKPPTAALTLKNNLKEKIQIKMAAQPERNFDISIFNLQDGTQATNTPKIKYPIRNPPQIKMLEISIPALGESEINLPITDSEGKSFIPGVQYRIYISPNRNMMFRKEKSDWEAIVVEKIVLEDKLIGD